MINRKENARLADTFGGGQQIGLDVEGLRVCVKPSANDYTSSMHQKPSGLLLQVTRGGAIAQDDIDALKEMMPCVLEHYGVTNLRRNFSSPWREDHNPSASFYPDTNLVHDFGTSETVDVFGLVGKMEEIDRFPDQVRTVANIVGYELDATVVAQHTSMPMIQRPKLEVPPVAGFGEVPVLSYACFSADLMRNDAALAYLHGRGFTDEKIYRNVLGFVRDPKEVSDSFTLYEPNPTLGYIVIPFPSDDTFCTVNYAMLRAVPADVPPAHKEIRPTGVKSPLYREWLLTRRCKVLCVTEGLLDCLALETLIHTPCIGLGGTGGARRLASLLYYTRPELRPAKVILALDADEAGRKTADRLLADIKGMDMSCAVMEMAPGCKDPNDMLVKHGGDQHER